MFPLGVVSGHVVLRKSGGDIRICGDYKTVVNHKVCSASYSILNVEIAVHALAGMSEFTKIDLKMVYHQIQIDNNFKEVITINMQLGLLKWKKMPYGVKTISAKFQSTMKQVQKEDIKKDRLLPRRYMHRRY